MYFLCGWRTYTYYTIGGFLLEAKAIWGLTCIAGGLFLLRIQQKNLMSITHKVLKQGYKDSNLEMTESESVALPFGDSPLFIVQMVLYINTPALASTFFMNFSKNCTKIDTRLS